MRISAVSGLVFIAALATPAFGQSLVGEWTATAQTGNGTTTELVTVIETDDGYAITAKLQGAAAGQPEAGPGADIVLDGDHFSYKRTLNFPGNAIEISYAGVVSGDTFTGTAAMMGMTVPYNGVRVDGGE
jgi:hypothetical protein